MKATVKRWYTRLNQPIAATSPFWRTALWAVIGLYVILALAQSFWVPVFEGPDEQRHYAYARYLVNEHSLPPIVKDVDDVSHTYRVGQESGQPPLYYTLVALVTSPFQHADEVAPFVQANPFMTAYDAMGIGNDNHNRYLHGPERNQSFQGLSLAVHAGRSLSVMLGTLALIGVYGAARAVAPYHPLVALMATGLVAFQPVFLFLSSAITNDVAVICFASLCMWVALLIARYGATPRLAILGGFLAGLTAMSKFNGIWIAGVVWLAILGAQLITARKDVPRSRIDFTPLLLSLAAWLLVVGWWYTRNALSYGDPFGLVIHAIGDQSPLQLGKSALVDFNIRLAELESSAWFSSGWAALVPGPGWLYTTYRLLYGVGILGAIVGAAQIILTARGRQHVSAVALLQVLCMVLSVLLAIAGGIYWILVYMWSLGRLMFPAIASFAVLSAVGWSWWLGRMKSAKLPVIVHWLAVAVFSVALLCGSVGSIITTVTALGLHPEIAPPTQNMVKTQLTFLDPLDKKTPVASVVGYEIPPQDVRAGGFFFAKICWKSYGTVQVSYPYSLQLVGENDERPASRNSYHGLGSYPQQLWKPGEVFCDPTSLYLSGYVRQPRAYKLLVSMLYTTTDTHKPFDSLPAVDGNGVFVYPIISNIRVAPPRQSQVLAPTLLIGDFAGLVNTRVVTQISADASPALSVTLRWVALAATPVDAKIFVHILNADGTIIAQHDHQPDMGWFPTNFWQKGDVIEDHFTVKLPAGTRLEDVHMGLGMYDAQTLQRLPATSAASSERLRDDIFIVRPDQ